MFVINDQISIPDHEIEWRASKSSGSGGQHVNTTNSQVELRWNLETSVIAEHFKELLRKNLAARLTSKNELTITSQDHRSQLRNKEECLKKFAQLLIKETTIPKRRKKTRPTRSSIEKRLKNKRKDAEKKKNRSGDW